MADSNVPEHDRLVQIRALDPATALLDLKVCDPAMGSGHFLVSLVDLMADQVIAAMAEAEVDTPEAWGDYVSPLIERIDTIRGTILDAAGQRGWTLDPNQLDDRHIIRRMVLKRCVYGGRVAPGDCSPEALSRTGQGDFHHRMLSTTYDGVCGELDYVAKSS